MAVGPRVLEDFAKRILTAQGIDYSTVKSFKIDVSVEEVPTITVVCFLNREAADLLNAQ